MKTLLTPVQVLRLAFGASEPLPSETLAEADIAAAEARYLRPVLGPALHDRLLAGGYPDFTADYLAPALACWTRLLVQPRLDLRTARIGTLAPRTDDGAEPSAEALRYRLRALRRQAQTLLRRAAAYLDAHRADFPEYDPDRNPLHRCTTDGGFVQTR